MSNKQNPISDRKIRDGKIDDLLFQTGTLMFLLKESNTSDGNEQSDNYFWFSEVVKTKSCGAYYNEPFKALDKNQIKNAKCGQTRYYNFLNGICKRLNFDIRKCSYVNLNPIGGGAEESDKYKENVQLFLTEKKRQIIELAPKAIICCGTYEIFKNNFSDSILKSTDNGAVIKMGDKNFIIIQAKHPTNRKISNKTDWERISATYNQLNNLSVNNKTVINT